MSGYGVSLLTGSAWLGVLAAGGCGLLMGLLHGVLCSLAKVNDIAVGIALMLFGTGLAFFLGKPLIQPQAPMLPSLDLGAWSDSAQLQSALRINVLLPLGLLLAVLLHWGLRASRWGLALRLVGDNAAAARALGYPVVPIRIGATAAGGFLAGVGGAFLSLYTPAAGMKVCPAGRA